MWAALYWRNGEELEQVQRRSAKIRLESKGQGFYGEAEGPGLLQPGEGKAEGSRVGACDCLKGGFRADGAFLGSGKQYEQEKEPQRAACRV